MTKNRRDTYKILRALLLLIGIHTGLICVMMLVGKTRTVDMLVYSTFRQLQTDELTLYDPYHRIHFTAFADIVNGNFSMSTDGRIAVRSNQEDSLELLVWDTQSPHMPPMNFSQILEGTGTPLGWSRDGRYLAIHSFDAEGAQIFIWDGSAIHSITSHIDMTRFVFEALWSSDGRFAFSVHVDSAHNEIFVWDGHTTMNVSQNPDAEDYSIAWSNDGQLAFLSQQAGEYDIYVWDGVSVEDGVPDRDLLINVAPERTLSYSHPTWTNTNLLAFPAALQRHIVVWDGQTLTNITPNTEQTTNPHDPTWATDGRWAFSGGERRIIVQGVDNQTIATIPGHYDLAWSEDGYLLLCSDEGSLSLWNGREVFTVVEGLAISAQWQSGSRIQCR